MERNVMGELNMHRAAGTKPSFSDIARRHGLDRHTVARYWRGRGAGGPQVRPRERLRAREGGRRGEGRPARDDEEGGARDAAAPAQRPAAARLRGVHRVVPAPGHSLRARRRPRGAPEVRDAAGQAAAVRLEGGDAARRRGGRGPRVQRVQRDARLLAQARVHPDEVEDDRRPAGVPAGDVQDAGRGTRGAGDRQHARRRRRRGRQEAQVRARREVRARGRVQARAVPAAQPRDQGQGRERQPLPLQALRLRGRVLRLGGPPRVRGARGAPQQRGAQRDDGGAARGAVHAGEGGAAPDRQHAPAGVDGRGRERPDRAAHDAREGGGAPVVGAEALHRQARRRRRHARRPGAGAHGRRGGGGARAAAAAGPIVYDEGHYAEALDGKRWADGDIRAAARANLDLLDALGGGGGE